MRAGSRKDISLGRILFRKRRRVCSGSILFFYNWIGSSFACLFFSFICGVWELPRECDVSGKHRVCLCIYLSLPPPLLPPFAYPLFIYLS